MIDAIAREACLGVLRNCDIGVFRFLANRGGLMCLWDANLAVFASVNYTYSKIFETRFVD